MKEVSMAASEFKAKCLKVLDDVAETGTSLVITKRGRPVARVTPLQPQQSMEGPWKGLVEIKGDLVNFDTSDDWETLREWDELNK